MQLALLIYLSPLLGRVPTWHTALWEPQRGWGGMVGKDTSCWLFSQTTFLKFPAPASLGPIVPFVSALCWAQLLFSPSSCCSGFYDRTLHPRGSIMQNKFLERDLQGLFNTYLMSEKQRWITKKTLCFFFTVERARVSILF